MKNTLYLLLIGTILMFGGCLAVKKETNEYAPVSPGGLRVAAYIRASWAVENSVRLPGKSNWAASQIKGEYLTDLMLSFAVINKGDKSAVDFYPSSGLWNEIAELKKAYPNLRINISVGGWGADYFSDMAFDPKLRAGFVATMMKFLKDRDLDGMDIDWEYPVGPTWGQEISSRPQDKENWVALLKDLRQGLNALGRETGKYYYLSTCVPSSDWFTSRNDCRGAAEWVDSLTLMAYDNSGSWTAPQHNANLYGRQAQSWGTDNAVKAYLSAGVPPEKLLLGFPTYGKQWTNVSAGSGAIPGFNSSSRKWGSDVGYHPTIKNYLEDAGFTRYWDDAAKAPVLYNPDLNGGTWVSYTDKEQIKYLADYAKEKALGGVFYWEYAYDMEADLLQAMYENYIGGQ